MDPLSNFPWISRTQLFGFSHRPVRKVSDLDITRSTPLGSAPHLCSQLHTSHTHREEDWLASCNLDPFNCDKALCFYSSSEKHFNEACTLDPLNCNAVLGYANLLCDRLLSPCLSPLINYCSTGATFHGTCFHRLSDMSRGCPTAQRTRRDRCP